MTPGEVLHNVGQDPGGDILDDLADGLEDDIGTGPDLHDLVARLLRVAVARLVALILRRAVLALSCPMNWKSAR